MFERLVHPPLEALEGLVRVDVKGEHVWQSIGG
jgi:hypothetical protein